MLICSLELVHLLRLKRRYFSTRGTNGYFLSWRFSWVTTDEYNYLVESFLRETLRKHIGFHLPSAPFSTMRLYWGQIGVEYYEPIKDVMYNVDVSFKGIIEKYTILVVHMLLL